MSTTYSPTVIAQNGIGFFARVIAVGDRYGLTDSIIHDDSHDHGPMVEFYDARYPMHNKPGQFVSRYYIDTLADRGPARNAFGLNLDGGIDDWTLDGATLETLLEWVTDQL